MAATPSDIGPAIRAARIVTVDDPDIKTLFSGARDARDAPAEGFFDSADDAEEMLAQRAELLGTVRRRFVVTVQDMIMPDLSDGTPTYRLVDADQSVDAPCMLARVEIDLETETTTMELFG